MKYVQVGFVVLNQLLGTFFFNRFSRVFEEVV